MKLVRKSPEPAALIAWKVGKSWTIGEPPWNEFPTEIVRECLAVDQLGACCYCGGTIIDGTYHIEHLSPQSKFPRRRYVWTNLLASCESFQRDTFDGAPIPAQLHCGHSKDHAEISVSPLAAGVEQLFRYTLDGQIYPAKTLNAARKTAVEKDIATLNLRAPSLLARRAAVLKKAIEDVGDLNEADWRNKYLAVQPDGTLQEFHAALSHSYRKLRQRWWP